ncbi:G-patch domain,G patch domain-containing protein, N-terminal [Cinara cedri]|uniref:G-patch domain,G patch domain-containing protein, N-terminal n=1 Tax=Cinara cedri TaxID=506608 RepID=A0A5E4LZW6_9HEMI|nr:G-patch domain,G patch domain-containing protein, N-terminal [Cinara cedri]
MSSDDECDEYIIYGNLLDVIKEDEIVKRIDAEQQFVRDENGRRRFHGAFTGGFSAGFYNTVGSSEGWTPSTFKSSRSSKSTQRVQHAHDFMDEEDKKDLGIDSSSLKIKSEYSHYTSRKRQFPEVNVGPIPGRPALGDILKPIKNTWGIELLKSMGWKPGQGVGPRLTQQEKLQSQRELANVGMKFNNYENQEDFNELLKNIKVSPYEYETKIMKPKVDTFGLGYEGLKAYNMPTKSNSYSKLTVGGKSIHGQAFGVGAYEEDDDDIYKTDDMSNYDFSLEEKSQKLKEKLKSKNLDVECIDGFIKSETGQRLFDKFPPNPEIPPEWNPQGMFDRIFGNCTPDFHTQSNFSTCNVNSRQREMKKLIPPPVEQCIKKEIPNLGSDLMFDRFTKAILPDDSTNALIPVIRTTDPMLKELQTYVDKKMYGSGTRKSENWIPDKLLCKRFNVPIPKQSMINNADDDQKLFKSLQLEPHDCESNFVNLLKINGSTVKKTKVEVVESPIEIKPTIDFFKDIFLTDSDEENSVDNTSTTTNPENNNPAASILSNAPSTSTYICPPSGIFANLNFDDLIPLKKSDESEIEKNDKNQTDTENKVYGPLPEQKPLYLNPIRFNPIENTSTDDEWTEKIKSPNRVSHHKKHKKHKLKKKKKKSHK